MAIKIDLLPGYVALERWRNRSIVASVIVVAIVASGLVVALDKKNKDLVVINQNLDAAKVVADQTRAADSATSTLTAETTPMASTCEWMLAASKTGKERASLVNLITQYIYSNSVVSAIDISDGKTVKITANVRDPDEYRRFMLTLRRASDATPYNGPLFAGLPRTSGVGSFAAGAVPYKDPVLTPGDPPAVLYYPITVGASGALKFPVALPPDPTAGAAAAPAGGIPGGDPGLMSAGGMPPGGPGSTP